MSQIPAAFKMFFGAFHRSFADYSRKAGERSSSAGMSGKSLLKIDVDFACD
jgi:hypothetical protein